MDEWYKRSGQIPAFGNWDFANEMPITQYFECARQAGLVRYSSSSGESDHCVRGEHDLYSIDLMKPTGRNIPPPTSLKKGTRNRERRYSHGAHVNAMVKDKENGNNKNMIMRKQLKGKVWDVTSEQQRKQMHHHHHQELDDGVPQSSPPRGARMPSRPPKPVDEDLYKIPPELLRTTKRKKMLGFISKCLVPAACVS